jgi:hypothetical protein
VISRPRSGSTEPSVPSCSRTRRRAVVASTTTSSVETGAFGQPRWPAIRPASLVLRSSATSIAWRSGKTDFTSTEERAALPVARKDIDRAALAIDRKRDFGQDVPSGPVQDLHDALDRCRVPRVEQAVEVLALPRQPDVEPRPKRRGERRQGGDRDRVRSSALDARDRGLGDLRPRCEIGLPPAEPLPQHAEGAAEPSSIHPAERVITSLPGSCPRCAVERGLSVDHERPERAETGLCATIRAPCSTPGRTRRPTHRSSMPAG